VSWAKLGDDYTDRMEYLSDAAFRVHTEALVAVMKTENGPVMTRTKVARMVTKSGRDLEDAISELVGCGYWREVGQDSVEVLEHMEHQPTPEQIKARRLQAAKRQHDKREKERAKAEAALSDNSSRSESPSESRSESRRDFGEVIEESRRDDPRDSGRGGAGRGGAGKTHLGGQEVEQGAEDFSGDDNCPNCSKPFGPLVWCCKCGEVA
jgi:hypothetical protein